MGRYYTQRWYIYRRDAGSVILCDYEPPTGKDDIIKEPHWTRFDTKDANFYPNSTQTEQIFVILKIMQDGQEAELRSWTTQMTGLITILITGEVPISSLPMANRVRGAYAYSITVTKSWNHVEEAYEEYFDSYSMDLNTFRAQMNVKLAELNDNEEGYTYNNGTDAKNYYQATDAAKLKGCENVIISVTCTDGVSLGEGTTQYKCRTCGSSLNAHTKECVMKTTLSENDPAR